MLHVDVGATNAVSQEMYDEIEQEQQQALLCPKGNWEGIVVDYVEREKDDDTTHMFYNRLVYQCTIQVFDVHGRNYTINFVDVCPEPVKTDSGRYAMPSVLAQNFVKATESSPGTSITDVLDRAKITRLKYRVTVYEKEGKRARNYVNGVRKM